MALKMELGEKNRNIFSHGGKINTAGPLVCSVEQMCFQGSLQSYTGTIVKGIWLNTEVGD